MLKRIYRHRSSEDETAAIGDPLDRGSDGTLPRPDTKTVTALPARNQEELLDAIRHSIYNQPPTDWSTVTNLGMMRAAPEVKETVNLATQYMKAGYDPQAFIARLAEIVCHDNFSEMHAFKHHQSIVEEYQNTREPGAGCT